MNKQSLYILMFLMAGIFSACSDNEDNGNNESPFQAISKITLSETISNDGGAVQKTEVYSFISNKLATRSTLQEFYGQSMENGVSCTYSGNQAFFTDNSGNTATYTTSEGGYATRCICQMGSQTREYHFSYSNNYLTQIDEEIDGEPYSTVRLQYSDGDLLSVDANGHKTFFQAGADSNSYQLPCLLFNDIYPLSVHIDAIYARLLGKQSLHLIARTNPEGNEEEWTDYSYQFDEESGKPIQIATATTSTGLVYDKYGNATEVTQTDRRAIGISIE